MAISSKEWTRKRQPRLRVGRTMKSRDKNLARLMKKGCSEQRAMKWATQHMERCIAKHRGDPIPYQPNPTGTLKDECLKVIAKARASFTRETYRCR